jgi:hypothetical protein
MEKSRTPEQQYPELKALVDSAPNLLTCDVQLPEIRRWLGRAYVSVESISGLADAVTFKVSSDNLDSALRQMNAQAIMGCVNRALSRVEAQLPQSNGNAFIQRGDLWGAFLSISGLFGQATRDLLVVDPYLDDSVLRDYAGHLVDGASLRLLTTGVAKKFALLQPALEKWNATHATRPVTLRVAATGTIHDRVMCIDGGTAWIITQSLKDFGAKAPATIMRFDDILTADKIAAYEKLWTQTQP